MSTVSLELFKIHSRTDDFTGEDEYLQMLLDNAEAWLFKVTRRSEEELLEMGGGSLPKPLQQAVMMLAGHWYENRSAVGTSNQVEVPYSMSTLVKPYIRLV